jgi:hypothetical protein
MPEAASTGLAVARPQITDPKAVTLADEFLLLPQTKKQLNITTGGNNLIHGVVRANDPKPRQFAITAPSGVSRKSRTSLNPAPERRTRYITLATSEAAGAFSAKSPVGVPYRTVEMHLVGSVETTCQWGSASSGVTGVTLSLFTHARLAPFEAAAENLISFLAPDTLIFMGAPLQAAKPIASKTE